MVFAYCRYTDRYPLSDFLASFIKQLVEDHPHVFPHIKAVYTKHQKEATRPHEPNLLELFQKLVGLFKQAYIIIDAVDEASDDTRDHFLRTLLPLQANLLLTSRPSNLSKHLPQHALFVYIDDLNQQDVTYFIDTKFQQLTRLSDLLRGKEELGQVIRAKLAEKSNGMYVELRQGVDPILINRIKVSASSPTTRILKRLYYGQEAEESRRMSSFRSKCFIPVYVETHRDSDELGRYLSRYAGHYIVDACISVAGDHRTAARACSVR
jgi:hypothetical protein